MTNTELRELIERTEADVSGALAVNNKRVRAYLRLDDVRALVAMNSELATEKTKLTEALTDIRNRVLCPVGPSPTIEELQEIASTALSGGHSG